MLKTKILKKKNEEGNSLAVPWLGHGAFTAKGLGSIPGQGTKISQAAWHSQKQTNKHKTNKKTNKKMKLLPREVKLFVQELINNCCLKNINLVFKIIKFLEANLGNRGKRNKIPVWCPSRDKCH